MRDGVKQAVRLIDGKYHWHDVRHWLGDAVFTAMHNGERAYFISSFDRQESRPLYFLSQLPGPAATVDQAIESLAPESVHTARDMGREVVRQGDMFAIPTNVTERQLRALGATFERRKVTVTPNAYAQERIDARNAILSVAATMRPMPDDWQEQNAWRDELVSRFVDEYPNLSTYDLTSYGWRDRLKPYRPAGWEVTRRVSGTALYGTAHTATEVATLPDGRQYARGAMYHEPAVIGEVWRERDHARRPLGKQWHLIARNTVPVRPATIRRAA